MIGICSRCLANLIVPALGVQPPSIMFSQSSIRSAPPSCALIAEIAELTQASSILFIYVKSEN
jgi:hypothetical protein